MISPDSNKSKSQSPLPLLDSQIKTAKLDRRSFFTRAVGASTLAFGMNFMSACGKGERDDCDSDMKTDSDSDSNPLTASDIQDSCDSDR